MNVGHALVSSCVQLIWPAHCAGCNAILHSDRAIFCGPCAQSINPIAGACAGCALPRLWPEMAAPGVICPVCARREFAFSCAFGGFEYGEAIASAIMRMKHGGRPDLARRLGRIFQDTVERAIDVDSVAPLDAVLPVPLHPNKLRHRGFNQALELARVVLGRIRARSSPDTMLPLLERQLLLRVKETRELGRCGPAARQSEVFEAFDVADPARARGRRFLVIDDVMTTGATLNECAETLLRAGAREVRVAALARAV
jgi:ComF family protein